jgi:hypothetical protein
MEQARTMHPPGVAFDAAETWDSDHEFIDAVRSEISRGQARWNRVVDAQRAALPAQGAFRVQERHAD